MEGGPLVSSECLPHPSEVFLTHRGLFFFLKWVIFVLHILASLGTADEDKAEWAYDPKAEVSVLARDLPVDLQVAWYENPVQEDAVN